MNLSRPTSRLWILLAVLLAVPVSGVAFERYNDGCQNCHGGFTGGISPKGTVFPSNDKHTMHRSSSYMNTECDLCHTSGDGRDPFIGSSDGTNDNAGLGCGGCHQGVGLRAHHAGAGTTSCAACHSSDGISAPEHIKPPYYGTVDTLADNPCNTVAGSNVNENWSVGDFVGLDNDGDGLYDASDPDCGPPTARNDIVGMSDVNGNSSPDVAAMFTYDSDSTNHVQIRDGDTGDLIRDLGYGTDPTIALDVVERPGQGPAVAVMRLRPSGAIQVQVRDGATGDVVNNLAYGKKFSGVDMTILPDMNQNDIPEAAVVGVDENLKVRVLVLDITTGANLAAIFHGPGADPLAMATVPDLNNDGVAEIALLERVYGDARTRVRIIDPAAESVLSDVYYGSAFAPIAMAVVPATPAASTGIAVLGLRSGDNIARILVRNALTGATISNKQWSATNMPVDLDTVADTNSNGAVDLAMLEETPSGEPRVRIHDSASGALLRWMPLQQLSSALAAGVIADVNGNGSDEVAGLGAGGVQLRIHTKDSADKTFVSSADLP